MHTGRLQPFGIEAKVVLPDIGENLQNHYECPIVATTTRQLKVLLVIMDKIAVALNFSTYILSFSKLKKD